MENVVTDLRQDFWRNKRVLLTGHTGFKGGWLALWLHRMGAEVTGLSLPPSSNPNLFSLAKINEVCDSHFLDLRDARQLAAAVRAANPHHKLSRKRSNENARAGSCSDRSASPRVPP